MSRQTLSTAGVARAVGVHPNTVRLYEAWGYLPPVPRSPSGYRQFNQQHVEQMRLARLFLSGAWAGSAIRKSGIAVIQSAARGDLPGALVVAGQHLEVVRLEQDRAEKAVQQLEHWAQSEPQESDQPCYRIGDAAHKLGASVDQLRNWERNGLIEVPRSLVNRYRCYSRIELGRLGVIRILIQSGYSTMAVLRMLTALDQGQTRDLRSALDTPRPDEDVFSAADRWLSALADQQDCARGMIAMLQERIAVQNPPAL